MRSLYTVLSITTLIATVAHANSQNTLPLPANKTVSVATKSEQQQTTVPNKVVVVPSQLPSYANLSKKTFLRFKIFEATRLKTERTTYLVVRFSCDPLRYSAWMVNDKLGVSGEITQVKFDDQAVLNISAYRQTPKVLVLEDAWDESEKSFIDRLRTTKFINISYADGSKKVKRASFMVSSISQQLAEAEKLCFSE